MTFWPPCGLLIAALLLTNPRRWPSFLVATLVACVVPLAWHQDSLGFRLAVGLGNSLSAVVGAWLVCRVWGHAPTVDNPKEVLDFTALLRQSEERYRSLVELCPDPIAIIQDGRIVYVNPAGFQLIGFEGPEELLGRPLLEVIHPEDHLVSQERIRCLMATGEAVPLHRFRVRHRNGTWIDVESRAGLCQHDSRPAVQIVVRDVTARTRAEAERLELQEKYRQLFENAVQGIFQTSPTGKYLAANQAHADMLGYSSAEELMAGIEDIGQQVYADPQQRREFLRLVEEQGVVRGFETEAVRRDGSRIWVRQNARAIRDANGSLLYFEGATQDVTERKLAEEALRESERRFALFMQYLPGLAWIKDLQGRYAFVNDSAERVFGKPRDQLCGKSDEDIFPPETAALFQENDRRAVATGKAVQVIETLTHDDGIVHHSLVSKFPIPGPDGGTLLIGGIAIDVTDRKRAEAALAEERTLLAHRVEERTRELSLANAELARANRLKDEFLTNMSHELRTPLTSILGLTEILQGEIQGSLNGKQLQSLKTIEASGRHLLALINDILDLAKIGGGKLELEIGSVSVEAVCQSSLQMIRPTARTKGLEVSLAVRPSGTTVRADQRRLKQVLVNLLSNAVKFTPKGGTVGVKAAGDREAHVFRFTVWDTGIGIAQEQMPRLFRPFEQLEGGLARCHDGTGLGLVLVERMVKLHGGGITVESEPGQGSRFTVSLPWEGPEEEAMSLPLSADAVAGPAPEAPVFPLPAPLTAKPVILVAEDTESVASFIAASLSAKGYRVIVARNGQEALERIPQHHPDMILTDVQMPGMHGLDLIRHVRATPLLATLPIIVLTGQDSGASREECLEAGADDFMEKPFTLQELYRVVEKQRKRTATAAGENPLPGTDGEPPSPAARPRGGKVGSVPAEQIRILLAEDNEATITLLSDYLWARGYWVTVARNGQEALDRAREAPPAVILMDIQMPGMHGLEAIQRLRAEPILAEVPVIAVTALAMPGDRERCLAAGANEYLSKPFPMSAMMRLIEVLLSAAGS
jgi:PAS domain S-box-containing protein